jgi:hypothetical protein
MLSLDNGATALRRYLRPFAPFASVQVRRLDSPRSDKRLAKAGYNGLEDNSLVCREVELYNCGISRNDSPSTLAQLRRVEFATLTLNNSNAPKVRKVLRVRVGLPECSATYYYLPTYLSDRVSFYLAPWL